MNAGQMNVGRVVHGHRTHTGASRTYSSWRAMRSRCSNPNFPAYPNYGARGIKVCERWNLFKNFLADMGERPAGKTLDRIDGKKGYEPGNCRWATSIEQNNNKRQRGQK